MRNDSGEKEASIMNENAMVDEFLKGVHYG
jgi:hypothetical protein